MRATQFPIFTVDVDDPANANARDGWPRQTQAFPIAVADAVKKFQPFAHLRRRSWSGGETATPAGIATT
jgi:hypothetical protein